VAAIFRRCVNSRERCSATIAQSIDRHGGAFDMDYEAHLYIARRLDRT
jgi:hypothetical protein